MKNKMFNFQSPSKSKPPDLRHPCHPWFRWAVHYWHKTKSHIPWRLFRQRPGPKISNFRARIISKHFVFFSNNQPYFPWYVKYFCTLVCWILLPVTLFSSSWFIEILITVTGKSKLWMISTQEDIMWFPSKIAILSFCLTCCLTCAARITMKNRSSPLQPFSQGNFMCWKSCVTNLSLMSCYAHA